MASWATSIADIFLRLNVSSLDEKFCGALSLKFSTFFLEYQEKLFKKVNMNCYNWSVVIKLAKLCQYLPD